MAMLATVLLQIYKNRETSWKSCTEGPKVETLTQVQKEETPVLILDGLKYGDFLALPKGTYTAEEKTFKVAFPGFDVKDFPAFRKRASPSGLS